MNKISMAVQIITHKVSVGSFLEDELNCYVCLAGNGPLTDEEKESVRLLVQNELEFNKARYENSVEEPVVISDPEDHIPWYDEWLQSNQQNRYYWNRLSDFLAGKIQNKYSPAKAGSIIRSIDISTDKIISKLENPSRERFETKGLVLGYVQSGKTANFTALIAKAADAGYRLVIVLTGMHNSLRSQTQQRLDCELTGLPSNDDLLHVDIPMPEYRQWERLTNYQLDFDKNKQTSLEALARYTRKPMLAIMKKNTTVLTKLKEWMEGASEDVRKGLPILVIDDEADQASIDTNYSKNTDPTLTNALIRTIFKMFPKHAYVGYTATPFANVFIDKKVNDPEYGRDIFPRNFIVSLPRPEGYMGADEIFQNGNDHYFVKVVPSAELHFLIPANKIEAGDIPSEVTKSLEEAILSFCLSAAARHARGDADDAMTMLIHTTRLQDGHSSMKNVVEPFCKSLKSAWIDPELRPSLVEELQDLWEKDFVPTTTELAPDKVLQFSEIESYLGSFLEQLDILELNSSSDDELDYSHDPDIKVVAIGGNRLSRGLTLEGLMTSFYLRKSLAYDTLLQMGRWFGYRAGYEDLTRIYTSDELLGRFKHLAQIEEEIREEIKMYEDEERNITPADLSVRIRAHKKMKITAPGKMGAARREHTSFSESLAQTIWFPLNEANKLTHNLQIGEELIRSIDSENWVWDNKGGHLAKNIPSESILNFLDRYQYHKHQVSYGEELVSYINRLAGREFSQWNVVVASQDWSKGVPEFYGGLPIKPIERARLANVEYRVRVLSAPYHLTIDLGEDETNPYNRPEDQPLFVLYKISKDNTKSIRNPEKYVPLFEGIDEKIDVIGFAIVFPVSKIEPNDYFAQPDEVR